MSLTLSPYNRTSELNRPYKPSESISTRSRDNIRHRYCSARHSHIAQGFDIHDGILHRVYSLSTPLCDIPVVDRIFTPLSCDDHSQEKKVVLVVPKRVVCADLSCQQRLCSPRVLAAECPNLLLSSEKVNVSIVHLSSGECIPGK
ncbi:hypothetical protein Tco_0578374 [Tanacetum coccineum]